MSEGDPLNKCSLSTTIRSCDFIGSFITFRINDENEYKSIIGGISSFIFTLFCIWYTIYTAIPFLKKENVSFIYANKMLDKDPFVDFSNKKMTIAFSNCYVDAEKELNGPVVEETADLIGYRMYARYWIGEEDIRDVEIPLDWCKKSDLPEKLEEFYDINGMDLMYCPQIDPNNNETSLSLRGLYTDDYLKYIIIETYIKDEAKTYEDNWKEVREAMQQPMEFGM